MPDIELGNALNLEVSEFMKWVLSEYPGHAEWVPFMVSNASRQNDKHAARATINVPDEWSKNIKGDPKLYETYLAVMVPAELLPQWRQLKALPKSQQALFNSPSSSAPPSNDVENSDVPHQGAEGDGVIQQ